MQASRDEKKYEIELKTEVERVLRFVNGMKVIYSHEKHLFAVEENLPSFLIEVFAGHVYNPASFFYVRQSVQVAKHTQPS